VKSDDQGESLLTPTESKTTSMAGHSSHGSRETPALSTKAEPSAEVDRSEKADSRTSDMHGVGESDSLIVPEKPANKDRTGPEGVPPEGVRAAEPVEGRGLAKENAEESLRARTQRRKARSRGLFGVREAAGHAHRVLWTLSSEARAVCDSIACTDLCGGPPAKAVPTAIVV
jgi:hypothetical protein